MSAQLKVLVVIGQLEIGGTERHLLQVLPALQDDMIECVVYTLRGGGALERKMMSAGVRVIAPQHHSRRWLGLLRSAAHLRRTLSEERPDVVHYFLPEAYLLGGLCSLVAPRCRRVMSRRSLNHYQRKWFMSRRLEQFLHRRMDAVLANSAAVLRDLHDEGVDPRRSGIVYNGVHVPAATSPVDRREARAALAIAPNALVMVMIANLIAYKGHADLIAALALARLPEPWLLLLVGADGGIGAALEAQINDTGLATQVRFSGAVDDVRTYLASADIALNVSQEEGFSNAVLEAMAAAVVPLVTAVGGNPEAVIDGDSGLVVPAGDVPALAAALTRLATQPALARAYAAAARERAATCFSVEACVGAYRRLYLALALGHMREVADVLAAPVAD